MKYNFLNISECNMCGAPEDSFITLGKRLNHSQGFNPRKKIGITTTICKCKNCNLIFSNPLPIPENSKQHYGIPVENYWKDDYFKIDDDYFNYQIQTFLKLSQHKPSLTALDIGAGIGKCMKSLEKSNITAYGIEPTKQFYDRAINKTGIDREKMKNVSIENATFEKSYFDFITFGAVLEHLYDPSKSIEKSLEWLKTGGLMHIEVPSSNWLTNKISNLFYRLQGLDYVSNISPMHTPYHLYEFSIKSFKEMAKNNDCDVVYSKYIIASTYLPRILSPILKPLMKYTNTGMQLEIWIKKK
ncbi:MAG: class I SAM-dependent methyltransferase [Flavobacteriaceae bacterium]|nr:class I SAM-dependent methyltransferase [Flavobacteriaceae bacterium]